MTIEKIKIKEIKGIKDLEINQKIFANKPNILVGVNGFGKTSIATAFASIQDATSIKLKEHNCYEENVSANPFIELICDGRKYSAEKTVRSNEIRKNFDIFVIGDMRKAEGKLKQIDKKNSRGSQNVAVGKMVIDPIKICKIKSNSNFKYKISEIRKNSNVKIFANFEKSLFKNKKFLNNREELFLKIKKNMFHYVHIKYIDATKIHGDDFNKVNKTILDEFSNEFKKDADELIQFLSGADLEGYVFSNLYQLLYLCDEQIDDFKKYLDYINYSEFKKELKSEISKLENGWCKSTVSENGDYLYVNLPEPHKISNGQRDIIIMCSIFKKVLFNSDRKDIIIIVDEIFDYLDDANLIAAQYYITRIIENSKLTNKRVYPIILTHLDPVFFKSFVFNKPNIIYLGDFKCFESTDSMKNLISYRSDGVDENLKYKISRYLLHYNIDDMDFKNDISVIKNIRTSWGDPKRFMEFLYKELDNYKNGTTCDPLAVCAVTRIKIEELAYTQIMSRCDAKNFFDEHTTVKKLEWSEVRGSNIPENHYLLKIFFDEAMHWRRDRDNMVSISAKLKNPVIKNIILKLFE